MKKIALVTLLGTTVAILASSCTKSSTLQDAQPQTIFVRIQAAGAATDYSTVDITKF